MHGDVNFSATERKCIEDSADQWRAQTNGLADVYFDWDYNSSDPKSVAKHWGTHRALRWTSQTPEVVRLEMEEEEESGWPYVLLGQVSPGGGIHSSTTVEMRLVADRLVDSNICRLTTIHELGHFFGLPHVETSRYNIMYPSVNAKNTACLKPDDLLMYCMVNSCGSVPMKPCDAIGFPVKFDGLPLKELPKTEGSWMLP
jgi:hypothetical protein